MLTRQRHVVEGQGMTYIADIDPDSQLRSLQAAACVFGYRRKKCRKRRYHGPRNQ
jgi:hypothetical protein